MMTRLSDLQKLLFRIGLTAVGVVFIIAGIMGIRQDNTFRRTRAVIRSIELVSEATSEDEEDTYSVMVEYSADGEQYVSDLGVLKKDFEEGKEIEILYNPEDPGAVVLPGKTTSVLFIIIGALAALSPLITLFVGRREEKPNGITYAPSAAGEERELYFLSDTGTAKIGHRIEDRDRQVLYEAKVTKFTLMRPTEMTFTDCLTGAVSDHLVGHEVTTDYNSILADSHSTFTLDGEDIWKHLKRNGITIESGFMGGKLLWPEYRVFRDGHEVALIQSSGYHVHEEDGESKIPARGFYRIWTDEANLDLLFVTAMAFARTGANDGSGGSFGLLFGKKG